MRLLSEVNSERARIPPRRGREAALLPRGFFSFNVSTSGGKTLASMSFVLRMNEDRHPAVEIRDRPLTAFEGLFGGEERHPVAEDR